MIGMGVDEDEDEDEAGVVGGGEGVVDVEEAVAKGESEAVVW